MHVFRFLLPLFLTLSMLAMAATPVAEGYISRWFRKDVELRSQLIDQALDDRLAEMWRAKAKPENYQILFDHIAKDERLLAAGLCDASGKLVAKGAAWPAEVTCPAQGSESPFNTLKTETHSLYTATFPIDAGAGAKPTLVVLHDLDFSHQRERQAGLYFLGFLMVVALVVAFVTVAVARFTLRDWMMKLRTTLNDPQTRPSQQGLPREFIPLVREMRQMLREIKPNSYQLENIRIEWNPATLKALLEQELPEAQVIVVSNREPYIHNKTDNGITMSRPASGVVTALEPMTRATGGTWIAHGGGSGDREAVDANDHVMVPPENPDYTLRRVWLTKEEEDGYYYGLSNEGMWPLCHIAFVRPVFRDSDWEIYKAVNRKFADAVVAEAKTKNPVVLVQDYHFALVPRYVREKLPDATIITFWHIPWPNPEVFSICPWREEILAGLLGSSILGFHTQFHCNNFMDSVDRFLESHINRDQSVVTMGDRGTLIRPYPISIAWPPEGLDAVAPAATCKETVRQRFGLAADARIGVGIERFDYTKGILDRFQSIRKLLEEHAEWRGKFTFIQVAAPTRSTLPEYQAIQRDATAMAEEINRDFGTADYKPLILIARHHEPADVFELFRAADFCVVSSLHDGMNLVAKEFVAARDDEQGVLILSTFAGASKELMEALPVNPYDAKGTSLAMHRALSMPEAEQRERMHILREMVRDNNVFFWAARILLDAVHLRKTARVEQLIADTDRPEDVKEENSAHVVPFSPRQRRSLS